MGMSLIIPPLEFLVVLVSFFFLMQNAVSCPLVLLFVFLGYGEGKKGYRCFDPITHKLYVSRYVVFLEHIPFFFIPSTTHNLT